MARMLYLFGWKTKIAFILFLIFHTAWDPRYHLLCSYLAVISIFHSHHWLPLNLVILTATRCGKGQGLTGTFTSRGRGLLQPSYSRATKPMQSIYHLRYVCDMLHTSITYSMYAVTNERVMLLPSILPLHACITVCSLTVQTRAPFHILHIQPSDTHERAGVSYEGSDHAHIL